MYSKINRFEPFKNVYTVQKKNLNVFFKEVVMLGKL